jgi:hypothetical protein
MTVDDAGRGGQKSALAGQRRLKLQCLGAGDPSQVVDPVGQRLVLDPGQRFDLLEGCRDDQLAKTLVGHVARGAEVVETLLPLDTGARLQAVPGIIDAGMDHLAVAGACLRTDEAMALDHHHFVTGSGECPGAGQADNAGADNDGFNICHARCPDW